MKKPVLGFLVLVFLCGSAFAGDAFAKFGVIVKPTDDLGLSDRYLIDFGSDYRVAYMVSLGWEIGTAYYSQDFAGDQLRTVPINTFVNLKVSPPNEGVRPFGKIGFGAITNIVNFKSNTDTETKAAFHLTGGVEAGHFVAELQGIKRFKTGSEFTVVLLGGLVW
jgi:hypothetical protein